MSRVRGSVLLVSLWATAALATAGIAQATRISLQLKWQGRLQENRQAWYLALTGVEAASSRLGLNTGEGWDAPSEPWASGPPEPIALGPGTFHFEIVDEERRLPLNTVPEEILARLPGFTPQAVTAFLARRQEGKTLSHLGELVSLPGFQTAVLDQLEPLVTPYGSGPVNIHTASREVLEILGLSPGLTQTILLYRVGTDGKEGTADDGIFPSSDQIQPILESVSGPLLPEDQLVLGNLLNARLLGVESSLFRVTSEGRTARHGIRQKVVGILGRDQILRGWHEE